MTYISPEHILLAMLGQGDCMARRVLVRCAAARGAAAAALGICWLHPRLVHAPATIAALGTVEDRKPAFDNAHTYTHARTRSMGVDCDALKSEAAKRLKGAMAEVEAPKKKKAVRARTFVFYLGAAGGGEWCEEACAVVAGDAGLLPPLPAPSVTPASPPPRAPLRATSPAARRWRSSAATSAPTCARARSTRCVFI